MGIIGAELRKLPQTGNQIFLNFDEKVNLFIGPNATGKTAILREIKNAFSSSAQGDNPTLNISKNFMEAPIFFIPAVRVSRSEDDMNRQLLQEMRINNITTGDLIFFEEVNGEVFAGRQDGFVPLDTYVHWVRGGEIRGGSLPGVPVLLDNSTWNEINRFLGMEITLGELGRTIHSELMYREEYEQPLIKHLKQQMSESVEKVIKNLADHRFLSSRNVEIAIEQFRGMANVDVISRGEFTKFMNIGYSCARAICSETLHGDFTYDIQNRHRRGVGIFTNDNTSGGRYGGGPLYLGALSSGTQGTCFWIWALAATMATHYYWDSSWEERPAILLIDEIENHLHPTWQRRVIPALLEHFPGLQIFATTHSPFVVAGLKAGQVHLLNRDENGVTATTNTEDVIGWTADEILRTMMGVDEPTDQLTVDRANRLRQLREKETLTPDEDDELNTLRRQVNESLLSKGGPLEAQRERYSDLMQQFLKSRQSELTQDGG